MKSTNINSNTKETEFNPYVSGQRLFLIKTPKFLKDLFGPDFELSPNKRKEKPSNAVDNK